MTYADVLDIAVPQLEDKHLERYVEAFEAGTLLNGCSQCAVGAMTGVGENFAENFPKYLDARRLLAANQGRESDIPPLGMIELVFEGWSEYWSQSPERWPKGEANDNRRLIYDACILELAKRASEHTPTDRLAVLRAGFKAGV